MKTFIDISLLFLWINFLSISWAQYGCHIKNSKCDIFIKNQILSELENRVQVPTNLMEGEECMRGDKWLLVSLSGVNFRQKIRKVKSKPLRSLEIELDMRLKKSCFEYNVLI